MNLKTAARNLFDRFTQNATLGKGAQRTDIPEWEDTEMNLAFTQSFMSVEALDGKPADQDPRENFIKTPSSEVALAALAPQVEQLDMYKDLMSPEDFAQAKAQLDQLKAEAGAKTGESVISIERPSQMESITTIESNGDEPGVEMLYSSLGGKVYIDVTPQDGGFTAEATVLPLGGQAFTETLSGGWELAQ